MIRHGSFDFLKPLGQLGAVRTIETASEMTTPVTVSLDHVDLFEVPLKDPGSTLRVPLDWWVHVGGFLREKFEMGLARELRGDPPVRVLEIESVMRADPVVSFEVDEWLEKRLPLLLATRVSQEPIEIKSTSQAISIDLEESAVLLGLADLVQKQTRDEFITAMRTEIGIDLGEPPWMFWSRLATWMRRRKRDTDVSAIETRLSFFRTCLSPQDERGEAASLELGFVMMNPTFETVERAPNEVGSREAPLLVRARNGSNVTSRVITSLEALLLDHVRESFRASRVSVTGSVANETGIRKEFVDRAVDALVRDGFLLGRLEN